FHHIPSISDRIASNAIEWDEKEGGSGARSSLSRLAECQTGMSAGRNSMKWKSEPREVWRRLEPSLLNGALAE
ncbi:MAG: hypothetical protein MJY45_05125, partial [Bacteroidales bacterium]|nr:hypothetical protein [Bacteroidales bacterium]